MLIDKELLFTAELSRREDWLADVLGVVLHSLVHIFAVNDDISLNHFAIIISKDGVQQMILLRLVTDRLRAAKRVECIVRWTISSHELWIGKPVAGLGLAEANVAIVDSIARLALISHWVGVAQVQRGSITHKAFHGLDAHSRLIEARKGSNFNLGLHRSVLTETKGWVRRMSCIPEVVTSIHYLHIDTLDALGILYMLKFLRISAQK